MVTLSLVLLFSNLFAKDTLTIAFGSCNKPSLPQDYWANTAQNNPQHFFWLGDNIYSDQDPSHIADDIGCRYYESPTAHTLFHGLKFDLHTAFQMLYDIATHKKGVSSIALPKCYGIQQKLSDIWRTHRNVFPRKVAGIYLLLFSISLWSLLVSTLK